MSLLRPFRAVRPAPQAASLVAAPPYDVVDRAEARALAGGNPFSFLHVSRAEVDLPDEVGPYDESVYRTALARYQQLKRDAPFVVEAEPSLYLYRLSDGQRHQTGVAGCFAVEEYRTGVVRRHERTRKDKEDDRTRHITELRAQTGPVFLTHRPLDALGDITRRVETEAPLMDFSAGDGVRHTIWRLSAADAHLVQRVFELIPALYIADGHHRAASAARARDVLADSPEADFFLAVAFPSDQMRILAYNRVVRDLNELTPDELLVRMRERFVVGPGGPAPSGKGHVSMYVAGRWHDLDMTRVPPGESLAGALDHSVLQDHVLRPILGIEDVRTDARIDFVGGAKGPRVLERIVGSGAMAVAFSMYPVSIADLLAVSDAGEIMPPKSTWFEPKLSDGLLIHEI